MAQRHDANWVYTESVLKDSTICLLAFDNKTDTFSLLKSAIRAGSSASYSSSVGSLKCYTNGYEMYSQDFLVLENGDSLGYSAEWDSIPIYYTGGEFYSGEFLPWPGQPDHQVVFLHYVVYYFTSAYRHKELWYSVVDLDANGGKGKVVSRNNVLSDNVGHFTCIQHGNGKDWWIISMKENLIEFDAYLLSESGIQYVATQSFPLAVYYSNFNRSPLISSPMGDWIYRQFVEKDGYLFSFNRCNGLISFNSEVPIPDSIPIPMDDVYGMKFPIGSPDGRFIYSTFINKIEINGKTKRQSRLMQADLESQSPSFQFLNHDNLIGNYIYFYFPQLTPDGRIFYGFIDDDDDFQSLAVIHRPNDLLDECGLEIPGIKFPLDFYSPSTPRFPNYRLGPLVGSECDTVTTAVIVPEENKIYDLKLSPNPSAGPVDVEITLPEYQGHQVQCDVFNAFGVKVSSHTFSPFSYRYTLDTSRFGTGMYTVHLVVDGQVVRTEKLVVVGG